jgi:integrase
MWHYRFWLDGREYTGNTGEEALPVTLGDTERRKTAASRKRDAAAVVENKARELAMSGRSHELKLQVRPFSEAAANFLAWADSEHRDHPNTPRRLRTSFASLSRFFGNAPVSAILRGHVNDYKAWRRTEHQVAEVTIRHDLHALSKAFGYWIDHNWARENPIGGLRGVEIPSDKDAVRMYVLSREEEVLYFAAARQHPALYDLGRLMLNQGCRPEEVLELQVSDVDLERSQLTIRSGKSRAARRRLWLTAESREICAYRMMRTTSPWLFAGKLPGTHLVKLNGPHGRVLDSLATCKCGRSRNEHQRQKAGDCVEFIEASRLAFVMYDFRHTFATRAAEAGMPVAILAKILGHADLRSVVKYVHVRQEAQDQAMEQFDAHVQNNSGVERSSGFRPVDSAKTGDLEGSSGTSREGVSDRKIN